MICLGKTFSFFFYGLHAIELLVFTLSANEAEDTNNRLCMLAMGIECQNIVGLLMLECLYFCSWIH